MKNSTFSLSFVCFFLSACAANMTNLKSNNTIAQIKIGTSEEDVQTILGAPSGVAGYGDEIDWYYVRGLDKTPHTIVTFGKKESRVIEIVVLPKESDLDFQIEYVKKELVPASDYIEIRRQLCHRISDPKEVYHISVQHGFIIDERNFNGKSAGIKKYYWTTSTKASELINLIKECKF